MAVVQTILTDKEVTVQAANFLREVMLLNFVFLTNNNNKMYSLIVVFINFNLQI